MAYVSRLADYVRGGVVGEALTEGMAVRLTTSGTGVRNELPVIMKATSAQVNGVGIVIVPPDDFPRPTDSTMYTATNRAVQTPNAATGWSDPYRTRTLYSVGKSTLWNPTLASGELGLVMRGGTFAVPSGLFVQSANIKIPGNMIKASATTGLWEYTATESEAVGIVEEYNAVNQVLIFSLWH